MIIIKNLTKKCDIIFDTTVFPDGTQQNWRMNPEPQKGDSTKVIWQFHSEIEYATMIQLGALLLHLTGEAPTLYCPYLPYARQDKAVSNDTTFARHPMIASLSSYFNPIQTFDAHSDCGDVESFKPNIFFSSIPKHDIICFPDAGAKKRYQEYFGGKKVILFSKIRDQKTGAIKKVRFSNPKKYLLKNKTILIVDDICDGGRTFIECAKVLKTFKPKQIGLAVSHGVFSQGFMPLAEAGIETVYTTNSLPKNNVKGNFNILDL